MKQPKIHNEANQTTPCKRIVTELKKTSSNIIYWLFSLAEGQIILTVCDDDDDDDDDIK